MSAARKFKPEESTTVAVQQAMSDMNNLQKRLGEILERDNPRSRVSFGFTVLNSVAQSNYARALHELESVGEGLEEYQLFEFRARRFIEHAKSLVITIKAKHTVGKSANVNRSKQKELSDKITDHFVDLKRTIIIIEKIQKSVRASDLSSTIILFKTTFFCVAGTFAAYGILTWYPELSSLSVDDIINFAGWLIPWE